jgi:FKBP-type peptidyl-prolyl cis-trans isomerase
MRSLYLKTLFKRIICLHLTPIFTFSRRNVHCASHSDTNDHSQIPAFTRRALFGAVALGAAVSSSPLSAYAETNVIDGQGQTRVLPLSSEEDLSIPERQVLEYNKRTQRQNSAPPDFPLFVREGYDMTVLTPEGYQVSPEGLIYKDYAEGTGNLPEEGQQVTFDYTAYNESAAVIDSSYRKGQPAQTRIGIQGLIPGFEMGIRTMKPGGKRRIVVPPELGPPVGPSTFFSAKQFEVFDVELRAAKTCVRRTVGMFSDVVCE